MKRGKLSVFLGVIAVAGFSLDACADVKENPYQVIIDRNPFNLRPIPPPVVAVATETNAPPVPPPEIKLTGITTLSGSPKAFLQVEDKQTKKAAFPPPLAAGDNYNEIVVVSIDVENNTVRIKNGDAETTLDFEKNGVKAAAVAATPTPQPGVLPHLNPNAPGVPPVPGGVSAVQPPANVPGRGAIVSGGTPSTPTAPTAYGAMGNLPARPLRTDNNNVGVNPGGSSLIMAGGGGQVYNPNPQPVPPVQPTLSREDAEARIEAQRRMLEQNNSAVSRLLPPTTLGRSLTPPTVPQPTQPR
jgi:hypothetical protein